MIELFGGIKVDWIGKRQIFFAISIALMVVGMVSLIQKGKFRYGVDFRGGMSMKFHFKAPVPHIDQIRQALNKAGASDSTVQLLGDPGSGDVQIEYGGKGDGSD